MIVNSLPQAEREQFFDFLKLVKEFQNSNDPRQKKTKQ